MLPLIITLALSHETCWARNLKYCEAYTFTFDKALVEVVVKGIVMSDFMSLVIILTRLLNHIHEKTFMITRFIPLIAFVDSLRPVLCIRPFHFSHQPFLKIKERVRLILMSVSLDSRCIRRVELPLGS